MGVVGRGPRVGAMLDRIRPYVQPTGEEDLLFLQRPVRRRLRVGWRAAVGAALLLLVLVGWTWWRVHAWGEPVEVGSTESVAFVEGSGGGAEGEPGGELVVSVAGAVVHPGVIRVPAGSRVADVVEQAGLLPEADAVGLNLARKVADEEHIIVPTAGGQGAADGPPDSTGVGGAVVDSRISINTASVEELTGLPGVGIKTAEVIVSHRSEHGSFQSLEALMDVKGIGPSKFEALKDSIRL